MGILIIAILLGSGYFVYTYYQDGDSAFFQGDLTGVSGEITQFYENMRFNHDAISYFINEGCGIEKAVKMRQAFSIISDRTEILTFASAPEERADILIGCSANSYEKEKNIFIAGEGGPTNITNATYPVITRGKILLYSEEGSDCEQPLLEVHELLHVFGYDHINKSNDIMFPYLNCDQQIGEELIGRLKTLYSIEPFADIYLSDVKGYKKNYGSNSYLDFNASVDNQGMINAENVVLKVYVNGKEISSFQNKEVRFGSGSTQYITNILLPSGNIDKVKIEVSTSTRENNKINNAVELKLA